ncbi:formylglycine-generating enzyme family protein [Dolichospermum lemmermannii CS-548]|uniref:formylglycine-generating enzyme family protein n=1 Tax=Dolichospermum lemmermannii TaxID=54295 RepID=UPI00232D3D28|nr:formylglycine-generating enzyme family protein [Dolichospermum lemmermannii]MDB9435928.1 formylglycine-generating enzyme family protein [Dolichospermum lemmermannii CS-548]
MTDTQQLPISIQPTISYPQQAEVGKTYLMTIDLIQTGNCEEWNYEEEEYPIYFRVDTTPLFKNKPIDEPAVVLHRFGGTYGAAKFFLTAADKEMKGEIRVTLVSAWGVPLKMLRLQNVSITKENINTPQCVIIEQEPPPPKISNKTFKVKTIILIDDSINPQTFDFQVAVIKVNQSGQSNSNNILEQINEAVFNHTEKYLTDIEKQLLNGALEKLTYKQIYNQIRESANYPESEQQLSNSIAKPLWKVLTEIIGEKVTKSNVKSLINKWSASSHLTIDHHSAQATGFIQDLANDTQLEMMLIPGDTFIMGSPPEELEHQEDESPQHSVTVQPFFMGKYQVTQAQWRFVAQLPQVNRELEQDPSNFKGDNRPVEKVSWYDAVEFCDRLSQYTGRTYSLPSEAEWEYACRAGTKTPFHFGETITTDLANYDGNYTYGQGSKGVYREETTEVGSFEVANNFGLYDMHGNVWEWCQDDWHSNYEGAPTNESAWLDNEESSDFKLLRGGSWSNIPDHCRSACRDSYNLAYLNITLGFRVVCSGAART